MESAHSRAADIVVAWLERFELNELKNEKKTSLVDDVLLETNRRADHARRRSEWDFALRDGQLALDRAIERPTSVSNPDDTDAGDTDTEQTAIYGEAVTHLYVGALGLARSDIRAALGHFKLSARLFDGLKRQRAESIARAAAGIAYARHKRWDSAFEAYRHSVALVDHALVDQVAPPDSALKELRMQIMQTLPTILDYYEQEASMDSTARIQAGGGNHV